MAQGWGGAEAKACAFDRPARIAAAEDGEMKGALAREAVADQFAPDPHDQAGTGGVAGLVEQGADHLGLTARAQGELGAVAGGGLGGRDLDGEAGAFVDKRQKLSIDRVDTGPDSVQARCGGLGISLSHFVPRKRRFGA